jgi:hypothetical protein
MSGGAQRQFPRIEVNAKARISVGGQSHVVDLADISLGGAGIRTDQTLPLGGSLDLDLGTAGFFRAVVLRNAERGGYGLRFEMTADQRAHMANELQKFFPGIHGPGDTG